MCDWTNFQIEKRLLTNSQQNICVQENTPLQKGEHSTSIIKYSVFLSGCKWKSIKDTQLQKETQIPFALCLRKFSENAANFFTRKYFRLL